ncbi:MAG: hypothetical protein WA902_11570 [Thermosynechococcaceae cyanobacterium]
METIAVTGPRQITAEQREQALQELELLRRYPNWLVGDAAGLDALAQTVAQTHTLNIQVYEKRSDLPHRAQGAERSTRMVKALAAVGGTLHAWPNKPAPAKLEPSRSWPTGAAGSGTWGTVALAVGLDLSVELSRRSELNTQIRLTICHPRVIVDRSSAHAVCSCALSRNSAFTQAHLP